MKVSSLTDSELRVFLCGKGLVICTGPFKFRIFSPIDAVARGLKLLYANYPLGVEGDFVDFNVALNSSKGLRRWWKPQVSFSSDGM